MPADIKDYLIKAICALVIIAFTVFFHIFTVEEAFHISVVVLLLGLAIRLGKRIIESIQRRLKSGLKEKS